VRVLRQRLLQAGLLRGAGTRREAELGGAAHDGERRAQLMRGVSHEVALAALRRPDRLEGAARQHDTDEGGGEQSGRAHFEQDDKEVAQAIQVLLLRDPRLRHPRRHGPIAAPHRPARRVDQVRPVRVHLLR